MFLNPSLYHLELAPDSGMRRSKDHHPDMLAWKNMTNNNRQILFQLMIFVFALPQAAI